jgi:hypothetical protein
MLIDILTVLGCIALIPFVLYALWNSVVLILGILAIFISVILSILSIFISVIVTLIERQCE